MLASLGCHADGLESLEAAARELRTGSVARALEGFLGAARAEAEVGWLLPELWDRRAEAFGRSLSEALQAAFAAATGSEAA